MTGMPKITVNRAPIAGNVGGTCGSGIVSSAVDVLWMRGVGGVRCVCVWLGEAWVERGEWIRELCLGCKTVVYKPIVYYSQPRFTIMFMLFAHHQYRVYMWRRLSHHWA